MKRLPLTDDWQVCPYVVANYAGDPRDRAQVPWAHSGTPCVDLGYLHR